MPETTSFNVWSIFFHFFFLNHMCCLLLSNPVLLSSCLCLDWLFACVSQYPFFYYSVLGNRNPVLFSSCIPNCLTFFSFFVSHQDVLGHGDASKTSEGATPAGQDASKTPPKTASLDVRPPCFIQYHTVGSIVSVLLSVFPKHVLLLIFFTLLSVV